MAAARLRKTFQYPTDDSDEDDMPGDLDEEEQDKLIERLKREEENRNKIYKRILLALVVVAGLSFLPTFVTASVYQAKFVCLLCITSLSATAYVLLFIPTSKPQTSAKQTLLTHPELGPVNRYLEVLNGVLSVLLAQNAAIYKDRHGVHEAFWVLCLLPAVCFFVIMLARRLMLSIDVGELEKLKYGYKGA